MNRESTSAANSAFAWKTTCTLRKMAQSCSPRRVHRSTILSAPPEIDRAQGPLIDSETLAAARLCPSRHTLRERISSRLWTNAELWEGTAFQPCRKCRQINRTARLKRRAFPGGEPLQLVFPQAPRLFPCPIKLLLRPR